jgi:hypothetical protein
MAASNFVNYFWDVTLEVVSKPQVQEPRLPAGQSAANMGGPLRLSLPQAD